MTEDSPHTQCVRNQARMLPAGTPEALQRVSRDVIAARHGYALHGIGHAADGDSQTTGGNFLGTDPGAQARRDEVPKFGELDFDRSRVERLVRVGTEYGGETLGLNAARQHIGIGGGQRTAAPIAGGTWVGAGRSWPHA